MGLTELKDAFDAKMISAMSSPLTEATNLSDFMGELITALDALDEKIDELDEKIDALESRVEALEGA